MASVREMVRKIQDEIRDGEMMPNRASELLLKLSTLYGNCLQEIREADYEYSMILLEHLNKDEAASRAKIRAETSDEHMRKQEARDYLKLVESMIAGLKYYLRGQAEEMRLTR